MIRKKNKDENKVEYGTVSLPMPIIKKIKKNIKGTGMNSVSAYVTFVLRQILSAPKSNENDEIFSREEEREVRKRLKSLGY